MDCKISEIKEKQEELAKKISLLQQSEMKKEEEAKLIKNVIQECKDNLCRMKELIGNAAAGSGGGGGKVDEHKIAKVNVKTMEMLVNEHDENLNCIKATDLIKLLEKYECEELVLTTKGLHSCNDTSKDQQRYYSGKSQAKRSKKGKKDSDPCASEQVVSHECIDDSVFRLLHPGHIVLYLFVHVLSYIVTGHWLPRDFSHKCQTYYYIIFYSTLFFGFSIETMWTCLKGVLAVSLPCESYCRVNTAVTSKHFVINTILHSITFYFFMVNNPKPDCGMWTVTQLIQLSTLLASVLLSAFTMCYITPAIKKLRCIKGAGMEQKIRIDEKLKKLERTVNMIQVIGILLRLINLIFVVRCMTQM